jgi:hypothetical protein
MLWTGSKSPLEAEEEDWLAECWAWLLEEFGLGRLKQAPLVLPTGVFFPPTKAKGHARAEHLFNCVKRLTGTENCHYELVPQERRINPVLSGLAVVKHESSDPAGTFCVQADGQIRITYDPDSISEPAKLIATFAHEIAHGIVITARSRPPGGEEFEEYAVDVTTAFLGFGIVGANSAFEFSQFSDIGSGTQGWSYRRMGYLSQMQWGFCLGVFLRLRGEPGDAALRWLSAGPAAALKKTMRYFDKNPERVPAAKALSGQL